jgi:hypothetical protein
MRCFRLPLVWSIHSTSVSLWSPSDSVILILTREELTGTNLAPGDLKGWQSALDLVMSPDLVVISRNKYDSWRFESKDLSHRLIVVVRWLLQLVSAVLQSSLIKLCKKSAGSCQLPTSACQPGLLAGVYESLVPGCQLCRSK